ncbi:MAG: plastocyanin/azurin family copper-binding protein [Proteobacteria bacterium]|nr:plastocyanin/azurin family copper-binding protein [Pseudomonadota bacterium]
MSRRLTAVTFVVALAVAYGGCDKSEPATEPAKSAAEPAKPAAEPAVEPAAPTPAPTPPPADVVAKPDAEGVVRMTGNDTMQYNAKRIEVQGTKVKVELKNIGQMPKEAMGHNFVVLVSGTDPMAFAQGTVTAVKTGYIPDDKSKIIAHTKLLGPGESATIEFELPGPGEYPFVCTFPGHAGLMQGVLVAT